MSGRGAPEPSDPRMSPVPSEEESRLTALLRAGLAGPAEGPVDVDRLLAGATASARRIRRRRRTTAVLAAAAVLVVLPTAFGAGPFGAGPFGTGLFGTGLFGTGSDGTAASGTGSDGAAASGAGPASPRRTAPSGTQVSGTVLARDDAGRAVPGEWAVLQTADLGVPGAVRTQDEPVPGVAGPTAVPLCAQLPAASSRAAGGRSVRYTVDGLGAADRLAASGAGQGWEVVSVVRVLPGTAAAEEMTWLRRSVGACAGSLHLSRAPVAGVLGDGVVLGYQVGDPAGVNVSAVLVVGVVQQGRTTASVELTVPAGAAADGEARVRLGLEQARHLLVLVDRRLVTSGLVAAAAADPLLAS